MNPKSGKKACIIFNSVLILITGSLALLGSHDVRYGIQQNFFENEQFPGQEEEWTKRGNSDLVVVNADGIFLEPLLVKSPDETFIFRKLPIPAVDASKYSSGGERLVRVESNVNILDNLDPGLVAIQREEKAALMIWLYDAGGQLVRYVTLKSFPEVADGAFSIDRTIRISNDITAGALAFMQKESKNSFHVSRLSAAIVFEHANVKWLVRILWGVFSGMVLFGVFLLLRSFFNKEMGVRSFLAIFVVFIILGLVVWGAIVPDAIRVQYLEKTAQLFGSIGWFRSSYASSFTLVFKIGHVLAFWLGTTVFLLVGKRNDFSLVCLVYSFAIFAFATEVMQMYRFDRSSQVFDFLLDLGGIGLGLLTFLMACELHKKRTTRV